MGTRYTHLAASRVEKGGPMFFTDLAERHPLPEAASQPRITPRMVIVHTMVGFLRGTRALFAGPTKLESHFGIGGPADGADLDGVIFQWIDTDRSADANRHANDFAISIETSDGGDPSRPWSPRQLDALIRLISALCDHHRIPHRMVTDPFDAKGGLGWHAMWLDTPFMHPDRTTPWTPEAGKVCPGPVRIAQFKKTVFRAIGKEDDMTTDELLDALESERGQRALRDAVRHVLRVATGPDDGSVSASIYFNDLKADVKAIRSKVERP